MSTVEFVGLKHFAFGGLISYLLLILFALFQWSRFVCMTPFLVLLRLIWIKVCFISNHRNTEYERSARNVHKNNNSIFRDDRRLELVSMSLNLSCQWSSVISIQSRFDTSRLDTKSFRDIIKVDSVHVESRFDSTQPLCSQLFSGPTGAKIAISLNQWRCFQAPTVVKTLSVRDSFEGLGKNCEYH